MAIRYFVFCMPLLLLRHLGLIQAEPDSEASVVVKFMTRRTRRTHLGRKSSGNGTPSGKNVLDHPFRKQ